MQSIIDINGKDLCTQDAFAYRIEGDFQVTQESLVSALQKSIEVRFARKAPDFKPLYFDVVYQQLSNGVQKYIVAFTFEESENNEYLTLISGKALIVSNCK